MLSDSRLCANTYVYTGGNRVHRRETFFQVTKIKQVFEFCEL